MAKVILGKRPESFAPIPVAFQMPDGDEGVITCTFKYRTRSEWGAFIDSLGAESAARAHEADWGGLMKALGEESAAALSQVLSGWDLDIPLGAESLFSLSDGLPRGAAAIMAAYAAACRDGALGN